MTNRGFTAALVTCQPLKNPPAQRSLARRTHREFLNGCRAPLALCGLLVLCACQNNSASAKRDALKDALKSGVITPQEYDAKIAQLPADPSAVDPQKKAALDKAMRDGLLTQAEYDAKLRSFAASSPQPVTAPAPSASTSSSATSASGWNTIPVTDPVFQMPAFTVSIPKDWTFEGAVLRSACGELPMNVFRASSPDGLTGIQFLPRVDWYYTKDERALKQLGWSACNLHQPVAAKDQAPGIAAQARPNPQVGPPETYPTPKLDEAIRQSNAQLDQQARTYGQGSNGGHVSADAARVRLRYNFQGHPEEEWFFVQAEVWDLGVSVVGTGRNGIIKPEFVRAQHTLTYVTTFRTPEGKLDSSKPLLDQIQNSVKLVPEYDQAFQAAMRKNFEAVQAASNAAFQGIMKQGQANQESLMRQHQNYMAWQDQRRDDNNRRFASDMARKDSQSQNFLDYVKDQQYYMNPETGSTVTVQNVPGATGVITPSTVNGNWVQLVPISH